MSADLPRKRPATEMDNDGTVSADTTPGSPTRAPRRPYEPSIFNDKVFDDLVMFVGKKISEHIALPNLEIEAKFGLLMNKHTQRRIEMGVLTETVLPDQIMSHCYFMTNMTPEQHQRFNRMFNELVQKSRLPNYKGGLVLYKHTKEIDEYVEQQDRSRFGGKVRISRDEKTGELLPNTMIKKTRILDLNIHSPRSPFDCRISINTEDPVPKSEIENGRVAYKRYKDRISYSYTNVKFDLTQVKESQDDPRPKHELELEVIKPSILRNYYGSDRQSYLGAIESFINNFRSVNQKAH